MADPIPMVLFCPSCGMRHVDRGDFATRPHKTHSCQRCGVSWRPAVEPTVGVQFLPGFQDEPPTERPAERFVPFFCQRCGAPVRNSAEGLRTCSEPRCRWVWETTEGWHPSGAGPYEPSDFKPFRGAQPDPDAVDAVRRRRIDAESPDRDELEGIKMLRGWLRSLHMNLVIGHDASQDMTQDQIAERLGEHPRGHERWALVDPSWTPLS